MWLWFRVSGFFFFLFFRGKEKRNIKYLACNDGVASGEYEVFLTEKTYWELKVIVKRTLSFIH